MSDNVVPLNTPNDDDARYIWVCGCGCSTFVLRGDSEVACAMCDCLTPTEQGGWFAPDTDEEWEGDAPVRDISGNGSVEFARRRMTQLSSVDDASAVIIVRDDGTIHSWSKCETSEQFEWLGRKLNQSLEVLKGHGADPDA
ncbi:MAG TPA: hypothetical protein VIG24_05105 [Acidimicrobiia bacterium]